MKTRNKLALAFAITSLTSVAACGISDPDVEKDDHDQTACAALDLAAEDSIAARTTPTGPPSLTCSAPTDECTEDIIEDAGCGYVWVTPCISETVLVEQITPNPDGEGVSQCGGGAPGGGGGLDVPLVASNLVASNGDFTAPSVLAADAPLSPCKQKAMDAYLDCVIASGRVLATDETACDTAYNACIAQGSPDAGCTATKLACKLTARLDDATRVAACLLTRTNAYVACSTGVDVSVVAKPVKRLGGKILKWFQDDDKK